MRAWVGFAALVLIAPTLDLGVFNKKIQAPSFRKNLSLLSNRPVEKEP